MQISHRVHLLPMRSDPEKVYAALDIFVLPSREEGSPNSLIEAMAAGRPPVAASGAGVQEILDR